MLTTSLLLYSYAALPARAENIYPVANFTYSPEYPQPYEPVRFDASLSYDPDGYIVSYEWNFGDGYEAKVTVPIINHTYVEDNTYQVTLTVVDNVGGRSAVYLYVIVNCHAWFRVVDSSGVPISNVKVTLYYSNSPTSTNWQIAPAGPNEMEIKYDLITQPNMANSSTKYRNPGYTASILRHTSNIGIEIHPSSWYVFFKFEWGPNVVYWPNESRRVLSYNYGSIETHYYKPQHKAVWNSAAGTYVIKSSYIPSDGVNPKSWYPIIVGFGVPALAASISPSSVTMDVGQSQTFTSTVLGGSPPYSYQWYLNNAPVSGATDSTWIFTPGSPGSYTVHLNVTDSTSKTVKSNVAQVTVNPALSVSVLPSSVVMDVGQSQLFTSTVSGGTSPYTYQWYLNDAPVPGATSPTWTFAPSSAGSYTVYVNVTDSVGAKAKSNVVPVTVNPALSVSVSPASVVMDVGQSQLFTSSVSGGTSPYSYQWYLNGDPVSGATGSTWTFTPSSAGSFTVYLRVTDAVGAVATSNTVPITVNGPLSVSVLPSSVVMDVGQSQLFTSSVSGGTLPYTYQWYLNGDPVSGATSPTWTFTPSSSGSYQVFLRVTDGVGVSADSNIALVTVNPPLEVTISPSSATIYLGQSQAFTSSITGGTSPYSYQWYLNGDPVSGATSSSWTFTPGSTGTYQIYLEVTDAVNVIALSNIAQLVVNLPPPLTVTISPDSATIDIGQSVLFTSSVSGGTPPFSYQWYLDDSPVSGATDPTWTFTPPSTGTYQVYLKVTDSLSVQGTSNIAPVQVNPLPTVSISPSSATIDLGQSKTFTSSVSGGTSPYYYQWYLNDNPISGATGATWVFTPSSSDTYQVYLKITDNVGQIATSNIATITVNPPLSVTVLPSSVVMDVGQSRLFTAIVSGGTSPYYYQWYLNDAPVQGATSSTWTFMPTTPGTYKIYVIVTDSADIDPSASSPPIYATVNPAPTVSILPSSVVMDVGQSQLFTSSVSGGTLPYTYQWYLNGDPVSGATSATWAFTPSSAGTYSVYLQITDDVGMLATSNTVPVVVNGWPTVSITPTSATIYVGGTVDFSSSVSGGTTPYSYQWYLNDAPVPGATGSTYTFSDGSAGSYTVYLRVTDSVGAETESNHALVVVMIALTVTINPAAASVHLGDSVPFTSTVNGGVAPYYYQWYVNNAPVSGANSLTWTFTPTSIGTYNVHLNVTDSTGAKAKSNVAPVAVTSGVVGGRSVAIVPFQFLAQWLSLVSLVTVALVLKGIIVKKKRN